MSIKRVQIPVHVDADGTRLPTESADYYLGRQQLGDALRAQLRRALSSLKPGELLMMDVDLMVDFDKSAKKNAAETQKLAVDAFQQQFTNDFISERSAPHPFRTVLYGPFHPSPCGTKTVVVNPTEYDQHLASLYNQSLRNLNKNSSHGNCGGLKFDTHKRQEDCRFGKAPSQPTTPKFHWKEGEDRPTLWLPTTMPETESELTRWSPEVKVSNNVWKIRTPPASESEMTPWVPKKELKEPSTKESKFENSDYYVQAQDLFSTRIKSVSESDKSNNSSKKKKKKQPATRSMRIRNEEFASSCEEDVASPTLTLDLLKFCKKNAHLCKKKRSNRKSNKSNRSKAPVPLKTCVSETKSPLEATDLAVDKTQDTDEALKTEQQQRRRTPRFYFTKELADLQRMFDSIDLDKTSPSTRSRSILELAKQQAEEDEKNEKK